MSIVCWSKTGSAGITTPEKCCINKAQSWKSGKHNNKMEKLFFFEIVESKVNNPSKIESEMVLNFKNGEKTEYGTFSW